MKQTEERRGDTNAVTYKQNFDYDRFGNMYRKAASNNPTGQENPLPYTPIEESDISKSTNRFTTDTTYDDAGKVIEDTKFRSMEFSYDANGRMVKASRDQVPDALSVYDASGMRVAEMVNDVWRFMIYDIGGKLVAEYGGLQSTDEGGVKYVLSDWQGSTRAVVGNTGNVQSRSDYTAFGEKIDSSAGLRSSTQGFGKSSSLRDRYALTEKDDATGLDHTWFRKNENQAGRWTSPDPYSGSMSIGNPQSFNRYSYVENGPTNYVDPSGLNLEAPGGGGYCIRYHYTNGRIGFWGPWICYGGGETGGGIGGGGSGGSGNTNEVSERCKDQVSALGEGIWDQVEKLMKHPPLIDIESTPGFWNVEIGALGADLASDYFGHFALWGESVSSAFDRLRKGGDALAVRGGGITDGIYYRGSQTNFGNQNFLLHEVLHLVYPGTLNSLGVDLDAALVLDLNIKKDAGMSDSDAVSRFFNSGCDSKYGGISEE